MKKYIFIILGILLTSISVFLIFKLDFFKQKRLNPENVIDYLKDLKSYSTDMEIEVKNDKQIIKYNCKQIYKKGLGYRLELNNNRILVYKDNKIYVTDLENNKFYKTDKKFDEVYKIGFIGEYINLLYTDEKIKYNNKKENQDEYLCIDLIVPGNNKNIYRAVMWVNKISKNPYKTIIYNIDFKETIIIKYYNFKPNIEVNNNLFNKNK